METPKYHFQLPGQFRWEDMLMCDGFPAEKALEVQALKLEPTDVVVASYPKTGTTLLQEIVWLIRNNGDTEKANQTVNTARVPFMEYAYRDSFKIFREMLHPRHMKTHLPYHLLPKTAREGSAKVVYIVRNPKDCLVSYYHFYRSNPVLGSFRGTWDQFFDHFLENDALLHFGNPFDHMKGYWQHRNDDNLHIVSYEDLLRRPAENISKIADFLECQISDEISDKIVKATKFDTMKRNPMTNMAGPGTDMNPKISPHLRKGEIGDWKNYFSAEQNRIIEEMERDKLKGVDFKYVSE